MFFLISISPFCPWPNDSFLLLFFSFITTKYFLQASPVCMPFRVLILLHSSLSSVLPCPLAWTVPLYNSRLASPPLLSSPPQESTKPPCRLTGAQRCWGDLVAIWESYCCPCPSYMAFSVSKSSVCNTSTPITTTGASRARLSHSVTWRTPLRVCGVCCDFGIR